MARGRPTPVHTRQDELFVRGAGKVVKVTEIVARHGLRLVPKE